MGNKQFTLVMSDNYRCMGPYFLVVGISGSVVEDVCPKCWDVW